MLPDIGSLLRESLLIIYCGISVFIPALIFAWPSACSSK